MRQGSFSELEYDQKHKLTRRDRFLAEIPAFTAHLAAKGTVLPSYVEREFEAYLKCGRLEHGFLRVRCGSCHAEQLVAFSCKRRGVCPSCGARRITESAALFAPRSSPKFGQNCTPVYS